MKKRAITVHVIRFYTHHTINVVHTALGKQSNQHLEVLHQAQKLNLHWKTGNVYGIAFYDMTILCVCVCVCVCVCMCMCVCVYD